MEKRSNSIDMVKGLSILTLFYLHFENGWMNTDYNFFIIRSPAFYIVIGWLWGISSRERSIQEHLKKRKLGLIIPYLWFSCIFLLFDLIMVLSKQIDIFILWRDIYKTICLRGIGTLWFLPALLGGELLFLYSKKQKIAIKFLLYAICFISIILYTYWYKHFTISTSLKNILNAPFRVLEDTCNTFIYISASYYISKYYGKKILQQQKTFLFLIGSTLIVTDFFIVNFIDSNISVIAERSVFFLGNICAGIGILLLFTALENLKLISFPLVYCGKNSLTIMAIHYGLLFQIAIIIDKNILGHEIYEGAITITYFIIAVILQVCIVELINKKFPFIIGK